MKLVCIVCPKGCDISVTDNGKITGATCKRGEDFAKTEMTAPMRTVCTTVSTAFAHRPVLPVRTKGEIPKEKIFDFMDFIKTVKVTAPTKRGDVLAKNVLNCGVDLIATDDLE